MHEAQSHVDNCFITLTYDDEHLPFDKGLHYLDFQRFMKRLRKHFSGKTIRFFMCGEYGSLHLRPHFHAILFGVKFDDLIPQSKSSADNVLYSSPALDNLWTYGFASVGDFNYKTASYVARYCTKKLKSRDAYKVVDSVTGEIFDRVPEFIRMSLKPGIGSLWFSQFLSDVYPHDHVIINGRPAKPPKFYDKKLLELNPQLHEDLAFKRYLRSLNFTEDNKDARLKVREEVVQSRVNQLKRSL